MENKNSKIQRLKEELIQAKASNNENLIINTLEAIINHHKQSQNISQFIETLLELLPFYQKNGELSKEANALISVAVAYNLIGNYSESEECCNKALEILQHIDNKFLLAKANLCMGDNYRLLGDYDESLSYLLRAIEIYKNNTGALSLPENKQAKMNFAETLELVAIIWGTLDQKEKARDHFHQALHLYEELNNPHGIAKILNNLGVSYSDEAPEKTLEYYKKALKIAQENNLQNMIIVYINNIGGVYEDMEEYNNAIEYYHKALELANTKGLTKYNNFIYKHLGTAYLKKESCDLALIYLEKSLKLSKKLNQQEEVSEVFQLISQTYQKKHDYKSALEYSAKYAKQLKLVFNQKMLDKLSGLQKKYEESQEIIQELRAYKSLISETLKNSINMNLIGESKPIKKVLDLAMTAAANQDANILIRGESGTGKEIIAHIIHYASKRKDHLFIPVNTSSVPESLAESEFFGYVKGAFTGAVKDNPGYMEMANKGTLFLDEIADTPPLVQAKLLRALESRKIKRLGSQKEIPVDFRLVAATNKNIEELVKDNKFRTDLLYRLNTIEIYIPPLRERPSDIEPLLNFFVDEFSKSLIKPKPKIDPAVIEKLKTYHFPGNVRELRNMVEKAMILLTADTLTPDDFILRQPSEYLTESTAQPSISIMPLADMEKQMIMTALEQTKNNKTKAAKLLGISRMTLHRKCEKLEFE
jgi:transcriptional regulator with PAS, ATPase and Fis domain